MCACASEEPQQRPQVGNATHEPGSLKVVQIRARHPICFQFGANRSVRPVKGKCEDAIPAPHALYGDIGTNPLGSSKLERKQSLHDKWGRLAGLVLVSHAALTRLKAVTMAKRRPLDLKSIFCRKRSVVFAERLLVISVEVFKVEVTAKETTYVNRPLATQSLRLVAEVVIQACAIHFRSDVR